MDLLEILQVYKIRQHDSACVKNPFPWQLKREQWLFVKKTKANRLYKCINDFSIRDSTISNIINRMSRFDFSACVVKSSVDRCLQCGSIRTQ